MSVRVDIDGGVATLTIDRPEALNALNSDVLDGIGKAVAELHGKADAIIVRGEGKAFVAGADIAEMVDYSSEQAEEFSLRGQRSFQMLADFPGPVIAAIHGYALGGGLELALACDILISTSDAKLGLPESTLAVVPGFGGTQRLARRVGPGHAKRLLITGEMVDGSTALALGLVDFVEDDPLEAGRRILTTAMRNGPLAVHEAKRLVDEGLDMPLPDGLTMEAAAFGEIFASADQKEGMKAFLEKRKPDYRGE